MATLTKIPRAKKLEAEATRKLMLWTRRKLGFTYRDVGVLIGTTSRTAQRWTDPKSHAVPGPKHRARVEELRELRRLLDLVFETPAAGEAWLRREVPLLDGRRPIDLIRRGEIGAVTSVLAGLYTGTFA